MPEPEDAGQGQATRHEIAEAARRHYERLAREAADWSSTIPAAIDAWEQAPEAPGAVCPACDGTNVVIVDYDRALDAPCAACHPNELYQALANSHARANRLGAELAEIHARGYGHLYANELHEQGHRAWMHTPDPAKCWCEPLAVDAPGRGEG